MPAIRTRTCIHCDTGEQMSFCWTRALLDPRIGVVLILIQDQIGWLVAVHACLRSHLLMLTCA